jgi:hypothetical protein
MVDVREHFRNGGAGGCGAGGETSFRKQAQKVEQDGVAAVPGVQEDVEQMLRLWVQGCEAHGFWAQFIESFLRFGSGWRWVASGFRVLYAKSY